MPEPVVIEKTAARRIALNPPHAEVGYLVLWDEDEAEALELLREFVPTFWTIDGVEFAQNGNPEIQALADDIWECNVTWGNPDAPTNNSAENTISFDTTGQTAKITQSRGTTSYAPAGATAPDHRGAIGVTANGVEGVDVPIPALSISITRTLPAAVMSLAYVNRLADMTGDYNNGTFMGRPMGEVRFDGASGTQPAPGADVPVTFKFSISPNLTDYTIGTIENIEKLGWQYLWVEYEEVHDTAADRMARRPIAVHVEDVPNCEPENFADLGIGL